MELHRADPAYRRRSQWALALLLVLIAIALVLLQRWLAELVTAFPSMDGQARRDWLRWLLVALFAGLAIPLLLASRAFARFARAVRAEGRLPPRHWRTWYDVRVQRGAAATRWADRAMRVSTVASATAVVLAACALAAWLRFA